MLAVSLSASLQIAFGPYVADYSRYLPRSTQASKTFWAVGLGSVIGAQASMVFGVFAAALAGSQFAHHEVSFIVGLGGTGIVAALLYFSIAFGKVTVTTLNAYGSFMSIATIISPACRTSTRRQPPPARWRCDRCRGSPGSRRS